MNRFCLYIPKKTWPVKITYRQSDRDGETNRRIIYTDKLFAVIIM